MNGERHRAAVVCVHSGDLLCVRLRDPISQVVRLHVPGGGIEAGEVPAGAAAREGKEETGYDVEVDADSECIQRYLFEWAGIEVPCKTHFFRARLLSPRDPAPAVDDGFFNEGVVWLPLSSVARDLAYDEALQRAIAELARG